jgi:uncharacterized protein (TIGR03083 family)
MTELNAERARRAIVEHTRRLADSATAAGPDAPVPTAPNWTITDLVEHVGQTQHWVAEIIERRITDPTQLPTEMALLPTDPHVWQAWLSNSADRFTTACSDDALDAPIFNAAADTRSGAQFWLSTLLNEAVIHAYDAANATPQPPDIDIDPDIAAALITNHLTMLTSPTWKAQRPASANALSGTGQTLQWQATNPSKTTKEAGAWSVTRHPNGPTWQPGTHPADVTLTGPAHSLLLTLTRRQPLTDHKATNITITGDPTLAHHWLTNTAHVSG